MASIAIFVTEDWHFCTHRLPLAIAAKKAGHEVTILTRITDHGEVIRSHGLSVVPLKFSRGGKNPLVELAFILELVREYRKLRPDIVHHVALKPVLYGSIAAWMAGIPRVVNAIAGLGYVFTSKQLQARLLRPWVRLAWRLLLSHGFGRVIVQNPDDRELLSDERIVRKNRIVLIRGAGVDTDVFRDAAESCGVPLVILPARLLWDKGVGEFVTAAQILKRFGILARFALVGKPDKENPSSVSEEQIRIWEEQGVVEWWGERNDMPSVFSQSHVVCLPSYREGLPKSLLEAASCGRAIVATDTPGCREVVRHNYNGLLVPTHNANALAEALSRLIADSDLRQRFGRRGREIAVAEFQTEHVTRSTLSVYEELLA